MLSVYPPTEADSADGRTSVYAYPLTPHSQTGQLSQREGVSSYYFADPEGADRQSRAKVQVSAINPRRPWQTSNGSYVPQAEVLQRSDASTSQLELPSSPNVSAQANAYSMPDSSPIDGSMQMNRFQTGSPVVAGLAPPVAPHMLRAASDTSVPTQRFEQHRIPNLTSTPHSEDPNGCSPYSQMHRHGNLSHDGHIQSASSSPGTASKPSQSMSSAISKHRAQRRAMGLSTDGKYYVDPKTGKHYFVPASGSGSSKGKGKDRSTDTIAVDRSLDPDGSERKKPKERRKLHKKEPGWELSKFRPQSELDLLQQSMLAAPPVTPEQQQGAFDNYPAHSHQMIQDYSAMSSATTPGGGQIVPGHWKPWSESPSRTASQPGTREGTPAGFDRSDQNLRLNNSQAQDNSMSQEWIDVPSPNTSPIAGLRSRAASAAPSNMHSQHSSPQQSRDPRMFQHDRLSPEVIKTSSPNVSSSRHRADSVYSSYSYYGDQVPSPSASPRPNIAYKSLSQSHNSSQPSSPLQRLQPVEPQGLALGTQSSSGHGSHQRTGSQSTAEYESSAHSPTLHSPIVRTDTTMSKVSKHTSLQLLATAKQDNLTVPKMTGNKKDQLDLSQMDPNHPLVSLHLGIDAHEQGELEQSMDLFEKSAKQGYGLGMLMYGLALRHGWVCR